MRRWDFERLVASAVETLPAEFKSKLENVDIVIEDVPDQATLAQMELAHPSQLLGLYQGIPLTQRGTGYNLVLPDKITLYQRPIEAVCETEQDVRREIRRVIVHELAHHFGIGDRTLQKMGR